MLPEANNQIKVVEESKNNGMTMITGKYTFSGTHSFGITHKIGEKTLKNQSALWYKV